jgi:hypothetical protein
MADQQNPQEWIGLDVVDPSGDKVGTAEDIYLDDVSGQPEWLAIKTGMFGNRLSFAPLAGATAEGDALRLAYDKSLVKDAPQVESDGHLDPDEEAALYAHYGRSDYGDTDAVANAGGRSTDDAMTRSEEEVQVGKRSRETGRAVTGSQQPTADEALDEHEQGHEHGNRRPPPLPGVWSRWTPTVGGDEPNLAASADRTVSGPGGRARS